MGGWREWWTRFIWMLGGGEQTRVSGSMPLSEIFLQKLSPNNQFWGVLERDNPFCQKVGGGGETQPPRCQCGGGRPSASSIPLWRAPSSSHFSWIGVVLGAVVIPFFHFYLPHSQFPLNFPRFFLGGTVEQGARSTCPLCPPVNSTMTTNELYIANKQSTPEKLCVQ